MKVVHTADAVPAGYRTLPDLAREFEIPYATLYRMATRMGLMRHPGSGHRVLLDRDECEELQRRVERARSLIAELEELGWGFLSRRARVWVDKP